jgi:DNA-dependent RNA polymerase auxiliary subunit epsilon
LEALKVGYVGNIKDVVCQIDIEFFLRQAIDTAKYEIDFINKINGDKS